MNELKIFVNSEFGEIEVLLIEGKEYPSVKTYFDKYYDLHE